MSSEVKKSPQGHRGFLSGQYVYVFCSSALHSMLHIDFKQQHHVYCYVYEETEYLSHAPSGRPHWALVQKSMNGSPLGKENYFLILFDSWPECHLMFVTLNDIFSCEESLRLSSDG